MKPQRTRCSEWTFRYDESGAPYGVRCGHALTHSVVGRWKMWPGQRERRPMCGGCAKRYVRYNSADLDVQVSTYRIRRFR